MAGRFAPGIFVLGALVANAAVARAQEITFFFTGDPQYNLAGSPSPEDASRNQRRVIAQMNALPGVADPRGLPVPEPRGVLVAGDLTQNGWWSLTNAFLPGFDVGGELDLFLAQWGLTGADGELRYPVLEGYGNHDHDPDGTSSSWRLNFCYDVPCFPDRAGPACRFTPFLTRPRRPCTPRSGCTLQPHQVPSREGRCWTPAADAVAWRNRSRVVWQDGSNVGLTASSQEGHYSWDWDGVHFVNLNEHAGGTVDGPRRVYARNSLLFLLGDLAAHVGDSGRPVVIMQHFGFDAFSTGGAWWSAEEREALARAIAGYNVVAFFTGHLHARWQHNLFRGVDAFTSGAARSTEPGFLVVRIVGAEMRVMERRVLAGDWTWGNQAVVPIALPAAARVP